MKPKSIFFYAFLLLSLTLKSQTQPNLDHWHGDSVDVLHYNIHLNLMEMYDRSIPGFTELKLKPVVAAFDEFALDLLKMNIDSVFIDGEMFSDFTYTDTILHFNLSETLTSDEEITVRIYYHGTPKKDPWWGGFFMGNNYAYNMGVGMGSDPVCFGRCWFPCVDDFVDRATYDYHITVQDQFIVACSGIKLDETDHADNSKTEHWRCNQRIPTYLSSVAVGDYALLEDVFEGKEKNIPIQNFVYHEDSVKALLSLQNLKTMAARFEDLFGPYRFDRIGYASVPFTGGAMEHAMNIALPPEYLDGTLDWETTIYHELSHMWFGDWVTCKTAREMWLNEGWASYCEVLFLEHIYGEERAKNYTRNNHDRVLKNTHNSDGGFYAVANVPLDQTYGSTSYDKGADRVHTIRGYLGDALFFQAAQDYLVEFGDSSASSEDLRDIFTSSTGIDMTDFFEGWIFSPGFPHFSIDNYTISENGESYQITVHMRQKLRAQENFINANRVELTFMDEYWNRETKLMQFDGETGTQDFILDFAPAAVFVDHNEKLSDAISNSVQVINDDKTYYFDNAYLTVFVDEIEDSAYTSVEFNWVSPDQAGEQENGMVISDYFYWKVSGIFPETFQARGKFFFNLNFFTDDKEARFKFDTLRLVYREDASQLWRYVPQTFSGTHISGEITILNLQPGEYALANNLWPLPVIESKFGTGEKINVYPNPSDGKVTINLKDLNSGELIIYNSSGQRVFYEPIHKDKKTLTWYPEHRMNGIYQACIFNKNRIISSKKFVLY